MHDGIYLLVFEDIIMKDTKPFFSIITCTYNSKRYISRNINSVIRQTLQDYEQVVVDGNSSDGTVELVKKNIKNNSQE